MKIAIFFVFSIEANGKKRKIEKAKFLFTYFLRFFVFSYKIDLENMKKILVWWHEEDAIT